MQKNIHNNEQYNQIKLNHWMHSFRRVYTYIFVYTLYIIRLTAFQQFQIVLACYKEYIYVCLTLNAIFLWHTLSLYGYLKLQKAEQIIFILIWREKKCKNSITLFNWFLKKKLLKLLIVFSYVIHLTDKFNIKNGCCIFKTDIA